MTMQPDQVLSTAPGDVPDLFGLMARWYSVRPDHAEISARLRRAFTPRQMERHRSEFTVRFQDRLSNLPPEGDLVKQLLRPFCDEVLLHQLGVPVRLWDDALRAAVLLEMALDGVPIKAKVATWTVHMMADVAAETMTAGMSPFAESLQEICAHPSQRWDAAAILSQVLVAGRTPTVSLAAAACEVAAHRAGDDDALSAVARAEFETPPFRYLRRTATREGAVAGCPAGAAVSIDIRALHEAEPAGRSHAFGIGTHRCLGSALARMTAAIAAAAVSETAGLSVGSATRRRTDDMHLTDCLPYRRVP
ncbi:hypothetical protein MHK71_01660 [Kocuria indica]|uniref:hypothetical protein n=1 Tax=Kocuria marina TaxID=223184 RepID=UPI001EF666A8|nr:hypothetical protein [Kocuria indica]MCG7431230.1 hypothetical protein [Kocuria indica]